MLRFFDVSLISGAGLAPDERAMGSDYTSGMNFSSSIRVCTMSPREVKLTLPLFKLNPLSS